MKQAFTLVELLVVVLIIGVLTSIAIPMYQGAVDKSHWSTMLPAAKAIKDAEEAIKMTNGEYTSQMDDLDVTMNNENLTFTLTTPNNMSDPNVIRVTNPKLVNVRLASYLDDSPKFAGQLHCEALKTDDRANRLCGKLLSGEELTSVDGYIGYLLDQAVTGEICQNAQGSWSTSKTKCYRDDTARCTDLGNMDVIGDGQCGYTNGSKHIVGAEGICDATEGGFSDACAESHILAGGECRSRTSGGCVYVTVEQGGQCISVGGDSCSRATYNGGTAICNGNGYCGLWSTFDGGVCVGSARDNCTGSTFKNGAICYANASGACPVYDSSEAYSVHYDDTSCCCGKFCPDSSPKCVDIGRTCDPQYMK